MIHGIVIYINCATVGYIRFENFKKMAFLQIFAFVTVLFVIAECPAFEFLEFINHIICIAPNLHCSLYSIHIIFYNDTYHNDLYGQSCKVQIRYEPTNVFRGFLAHAQECPRIDKNDRI